MEDGPNILSSSEYPNFQKNKLPGSKLGVQMIQHPSSYKVQIFDQLHLQSKKKVHMILLIIKLNIEGSKLEFGSSETMLFF